jgi:hypothetical protein
MRPHRGVNILTLWATADEKGYTSGAWGTYRRAVRKGEKAAYIVFYKEITVASDEPDSDEAETQVFHRRGRGGGSPRRIWLIAPAGQGASPSAGRPCRAPPVRGAIRPGLTVRRSPSRGKQLLHLRVNALAVRAHRVHSRKSWVNYARHLCTKKEVLKQGHGFCARIKPCEQQRSMPVSSCWLTTYRRT